MRGLLVAGIGGGFLAAFEGMHASYLLDDTPGGLVCRGNPLLALGLALFGLGFGAVIVWALARGEGRQVLRYPRAWTAIICAPIALGGAIHFAGYELTVGLDCVRLPGGLRRGAEFAWKDISAARIVEEGKKASFRRRLYLETSSGEHRADLTSYARVDVERITAAFGAHGLEVKIEKR